MKYSDKKLSDTKVSLTVTVTADELKKAEQSAIKVLAKGAKVAGFREGKVPANVAAKHINQETLQQRILENALSSALIEIYNERKMQPLDQPKVDIKKFVPGQELEFTAELDIIPDITLGDFKKLTSKKKAVSVKEKDVNEVIDRLRDSLAEKTEVKRAAKNGDDVVIDFTGKQNGKEFEGGAAKDYQLTLGSGQFIPGFEEGVVGHKAGDSFTVSLTFPDDYHAKDMQGAKVEFDVTLHKVTEKTLPAVDDEFAAKVGPFTTPSELKSDIKKELTKQKENESLEKLKDELVKELVSKSKVPLPEVLVDDQAKSIEQDFAQNLAYQGLTIDSFIETSSFKDKDDWRKKEVRPAAERRVAAGLVLAELAKQLKVTASEEEIDQHVEQYKQSYANNPDAAKQLSTPEARQDISNRLLTEKTVNTLVELNS